MKVEVDEILGALICIGLIVAWSAMLWTLVLGG